MELDIVSSAAKIQSTDQLCRHDEQPLVEEERILVVKHLLDSNDIRLGKGKITSVNVTAMENFYIDHSRHKRTVRRR